MQSPSQLISIAITQTYVDLSWILNSTDQTGVRIWRTEDSTWKVFNQIHWSSNPSLTTFRDATVLTGLTYYYKVSVWTPTGQSGFSNGITVVIPGEALNAPSNLTAIALNSTQIRLNWTDNSSNEDGFQIQRLSNNVWSVIALVGPNSISYTDTGLQPSTTYAYRVGAIKGVIVTTMN